jgi:hypothetical protein
MKNLNIFELFDTVSDEDSITIHEYSTTTIGNKRHFIDDEWILEIENKVIDFFFYIGTDYNYLKIYIEGHNKSKSAIERGL